MINWASNVFPGILGRTCDRPASRRAGAGRWRTTACHPNRSPICRLKRVAADMKNGVQARMPSVAAKNGKRVACIGAGPASLTVARDLAPLGYDVTVYDGEAKAGGFIRSRRFPRSACRNR